MCQIGGVGTNFWKNFWWIFAEEEDFENEFLILFDDGVYWTWTGFGG